MILCVTLVLWAQCYLEADSVIRGIYINPYQANKSEYMEEVFARADSGLINAIIVDFKSDYGFLTYGSDLDMAKKIDAGRRYFDAAQLVENAARHNLKLIARIVCFRDNYLSRHKGLGIKDDSGNVWLDYKGMAWTNPYDEAVQDYLIAVAKEIVQKGIRSIAFDYLRFPTDGEVWRIRLTKVKGSRVDAIANFLQKAKKQIDAEIGVCVFGFSVWHKLRSEGQDLEELGQHIDVLYPMLYPSHFARNFKNEEDEMWRNYWIYYDSVIKASKTLPAGVKVVPFVQGFEYRAKKFDADYVFNQIDGVLSSAGNGFMVWNARSDYSTCWPALEWARNSILRRYAQKCPDIRKKAIGHRHREKDLR
jgi:hypothetical protein